jgi:tryptophan-rich sensory protein
MGKFSKIAVLVVTCVFAGYLAGAATQSGVNDWYPILKKPAFNPPNWIFAPVWTVLYVLMGVAGGLVWDKTERDPQMVKRALAFFSIQLALNILWSFLFFNLHNPFLALVEIALLWLIVYETYFVFRKIDKVAGWFFIPYILWVTFAAVLNGSIWWLNR